MKGSSKQTSAEKGRKMKVALKDAILAAQTILESDKAVRSVEIEFTANNCDYTAKVERNWYFSDFVVPFVHEIRIIK